MALSDPRLRVVLVGCGNIGSRLLQSLACVDGPALDIDVIEPFARARNQATVRFEAVREGRDHALRFVETAPRGADLAVVATDSRNRLGALRDLAAADLPKRLVLEKFLFTRAADYSEAGEILAAKDTQAWVNCSRNEWPGYGALKDALGPRAIGRVTVSGGDWGLACNSIHHLALIEYLTDDEIASLDWVEPPAVREAKRPGYLELTGSLSGYTRGGADFIVSSVAGSTAPLEVRVETVSRSVVVHEAAGTQSDESETPPRPFEIRLASQLSPIFRRIMMEGASTLPEYESSSRLHLKTMAVLNEGFFGSRDLTKECPVT